MQQNTAEPFNAASYLVERRLTAGDAEKVAVRGSRSLTYAELDRLDADVAAGYRQLGLRREDRVMLVMSDDIEMLGAKPEAIAKAEDRALFKAAMEKVGLECPRAGVAHSIADAWKVVETTGFPAILRPSFTLGGTGGGVAYTKA